MRLFAGGPDGGDVHRRLPDEAVPRRSVPQTGEPSFQLPRGTLRLTPPSSGSPPSGGPSAQPPLGSMGSQGWVSPRPPSSGGRSDCRLLSLGPFPAAGASVRRDAGRPGVLSARPSFGGAPGERRHRACVGRAGPRNDTRVDGVRLAPGCSDWCAVKAPLLRGGLGGTRGWKGRGLLWGARTGVLSVPPCFDAPSAGRVLALTGVAPMPLA